MTIEYRTIEKSDYPFLREMLYVAIFVPPGKEPYPHSILDLPDIAKYVEDWGKPGDFGLILQINGESIGVVWGRLYTENNKSYGFVDADTPEMTIAVKSDYQNRGLGTQLMKAFFKVAKEKGFKALSLSVDQRNRAVQLYKRLGFEIVNKPGTDYTMLKKIGF